MSQDFAQLLPGVPSVESPFFEQIFSQPSIDEETRRVANDLRRDGYAVIDFPDPDFDRVAERIKSSLHDRYNWDRWRNEGHAKGHGLRIQDAWAFNADVHRLATNQAIIRLLSTLFGRRAWPFQTLNFPVGTQQHVHTDAVHFSSIPERFMCGVWTALEDIDETAGPLIYYPGTHKWPIFTNEHIGICAANMEKNPTQQAYEPTWRALIEASGIQPRTFTARKGQALIWLSNLLHGGSQHLDPQRTRWSQVTHYYFEDCVYYTPMTSDPFYGNISYRTLRDIGSGEMVPNQYLGNVVPEQVIERSRNKPKALPPGFDPVAYLRANPDVAAGGMDAGEHYLTYGWRENRKLK